MVRYYAMYVGIIICGAPQAGNDLGVLFLSVSEKQGNLATEEPGRKKGGSRAASCTLPFLQASGVLLTFYLVELWT